MFPKLSLAVIVYFPSPVNDISCFVVRLVPDAVKGVEEEVEPVMPVQDQDILSRPAPVSSMVTLVSCCQYSLSMDVAFDGEIEGPVPSPP